MTQTEVTDEEIQAVYSAVAETVADALGLDTDEVELKSSLIDDLDAESIDFLDLVFRLERSFKVKIPRGQVIEDAQGEMTEADFEEQGFVTEAGMAQLKSFLNEVPDDRFKSPMRSADIPRLFTTETFCKMVVRAQRAAG